MLQNLNSLSDMPPRLYRSPAEIRADIKHISDEMARIDSMLSVHNLRISMLGECSSEDLKQKIIELKSAVGDADKSLRLLVRFGSAVAELGRELDESICVLNG